MPDYPLSAIGGGIEIKAEGPSGDTGSGVATFIDGVASLNTGRTGLSAAESNGLIYAIGGLDSGDNTLASVERSKPYETVESASGQLIASTDANNGQVRNPDTGVISGEVAYKEGDTIQWFAQSGGYLYTIGE